MPGLRLPGHAALHALVGLTLFCMTGCQPPGSQPSGGDPDNQRLHQLSTDPVFASLPAGAVATGPLQMHPARYRAPAFQAPGWDGPSVSLTFTSTQSPASVFAFFQARSAVVGWSPGVNRNALGYPQTWTKTYPDGVRADLSLIQTVRAPNGGAGTYVLTASSPPAV